MKPKNPQSPRWASLLLIALSGTALGSGWSETVPVFDDETLTMSYRAAWTGQELVVAVKIEPNWHTFAMDNRSRQKAKLAERPSLGVEKPTTITVEGGLAVSGPWRQSEPKDFSKPELLWFSWGFEDQATFVAPAKRISDDPARVTVRGQACSGSICRNIEVVLTVPPVPFPAARDNLPTLVPLLP